VGLAVIVAEKEFGLGVSIHGVEAVAKHSADLVPGSGLLIQRVR
jgi:hypothetical protein